MYNLTYVYCSQVLKFRTDAEVEFRALILQLSIDVFATVNPFGLVMLSSQLRDSMAEYLLCKGNVNGMATNVHHAMAANNNNNNVKDNKRVNCVCSRTLSWWAAETQWKVRNPAAFQFYHSKECFLK